MRIVIMSAALMGNACGTQRQRRTMERGGMTNVMRWTLVRSIPSLTRGEFHLRTRLMSDTTSATKK